MTIIEQSVYIQNFQTSRVISYIIGYTWGIVQNYCFKVMDINPILWKRGIGYKNISKSDKTVYLTTTYERVVPLTHYSFITCTQGLFKVLKDKELEKEVMKTTNTLHTIQDAKGNFNDTNYQRINKTIKIFRDKNNRFDL